MTVPDADPDPSTLPLPRILCLHGGGVNATVFRMQCRAIISHLRTTFRLVFVNAPFPSPPHEAIVAVYGEVSPFYRWLRWKDDHADISPSGASRRILARLEDAMRDDDGTGEWVGLLGFSQGAKLTASLLWAQDHIRDEDHRPLPGVDFRFGVLMAGSAPLILLDRSGTIPTPPYMADAAQITQGFTGYPPPRSESLLSDKEYDAAKHIIHIPTVHVHGLVDPGLKQHRILLDSYCAKGTTRLVEWNGDHRLPIKTDDVSKVVEKILEAARQGGVPC